MALSPIALVTVEQARRALGIADTSRDADVETAINAASQMAETVYCRRPLKVRTVTNLRVAGPARRRDFYPDLLPIDATQAVTVIVNGTEQTLWRSEADGNPEEKDVQVYSDFLYRACGWVSTSRAVRNVVLSYTGGYDPVPDDLQEATLELIQKMWAPLMEGRTEVASFASTGGSLQTLEGQWAGGTTPWALTRRAQDVYEYHRRLRVG